MRIFIACCIIIANVVVQPADFLAVFFINKLNKKHSFRVALQFIFCTSLIWWAGRRGTWRIGNGCIKCYGLMAVSYKLSVDSNSSSGTVLPNYALQCKSRGLNYPIPWRKWEWCMYRPYVNRTEMMLLLCAVILRTARCLPINQPIVGLAIAHITDSIVVLSFCCSVLIL